MPSVYLLFGSNLGNRITNIRRAILSLVELEIELLQVSHFYETEAWGVEEQAHFLNVCAKFKTDKSPEELLKILKQTELKVGRLNRGKWENREIDIDILFYGKKRIKTETVEIPHRYLIKRNFALQPLKEIAPQKKHPKYNLNVRKLSKLCTDKKRVLKLRYKPKVEHIYAV